MAKLYMYNVWNTIHPDETQAVIQHANKVRFGATNEKIKEESIIITEQW